MIFKVVFCKKLKIFSLFLLTLFAVNIGLTNIANASTISEDSNTNVAVPFSGYTMQGSGGTTIGAWHFMYTTGPFALFRNSVTGDWKHVQIISTTQYTINVIFDGYFVKIWIKN